MVVIRCFRRLLLIVLLTGVTADLVTDSSSDGIIVDDDFKQQQQQQLSTSDLVRICTERLKYEPTLKRAEATTSKLSLRSLISCYFLTAATGSRNAATTVGDGLMSDSALYTGDDTSIDAEQNQEQKHAIDDVSKRAPVPNIRHPSLTFASSPATVGYPNYRHIGLRMDFGKRGAPLASAVRRERRQQAGHYGFRMDFGKRRAPSSPSAIARNFASLPSVRQHLGYRMDFGKRRVPSPSSRAIIGSMGRGLRSGVKVAIRQPQHFGYRTDFGKRSADEDMQQISEY